MYGTGAQKMQMSKLKKPLPALTTADPVLTSELPTQDTILSIHELSSTVDSRENMLRTE